MRIIWLEMAENDLDEIVDYLLERDIGAADRTYHDIQEQVRSLEDYPGLGRPGRVVGTRELIVARTRYIVAYTVDPELDAVIVLRVLHGARRWPDSLP